MTTFDPKDPATIEMLLTLAAILLTNAPGDTFTASQLFAQVREIVSPEPVPDADLQQGLQAATFLDRIEDHFQLR